MIIKNGANRIMPNVHVMTTNQNRKVSLPDARGHFGPYGGSFVPETLAHPLNELRDAYYEAREDPIFNNDLNELLKNFAGRPTELYFAERLSAKLDGAKIFLKREDLLHTGARKINNALGQALLGKAYGEAKNHCRNWSWSAWNCDRCSLCEIRARM